MACVISCGTVSLEHGLHPGLALDCRLGFSKRSHRGHEGPEKGRVSALLRTLPSGQPWKLGTGQVLSQGRRGTHSRERCRGCVGVNCCYSLRQTVWFPRLSQTLSEVSPEPLVFLPVPPS